MRDRLPDLGQPLEQRLPFLQLPHQADVLAALRLTASTQVSLFLERRKRADRQRQATAHRPKKHRLFADEFRISGPRHQKLRIFRSLQCHDGNAADAN